MAKFNVGTLHGGDVWVNSNPRAHWIVQWHNLDDRGWQTVAPLEGRFSLKAGMKVLLKLYATRNINYKTRKYSDSTMLGGEKAFRLFNTKTQEEILPEIFEVSDVVQSMEKDNISMISRTTWKKV